MDKIHHNYPLSSPYGLKYKVTLDQKNKQTGDTARIYIYIYILYLNIVLEFPVLGMVERMEEDLL